jgi:hypothetical protein
MSYLGLYVTKPAKDEQLPKKQAKDTRNKTQLGKYIGILIFLSVDH